MASFVVFVRALVGGVFVFSAMTKLRSRGQFVAFVSSVRAMGLVPACWTTPIAVAVAASELAAAVLVAVDRLYRLGLVLAVVLLVVFLIAIAVVARRGLEATCRCLGASTRPLGALHLARNAGLAVIALAAVISPGSPLPSAEESVALVAAALAVFVHLVFLDDLAELFSASRSSASHTSATSLR